MGAIKRTYYKDSCCCFCYKFNICCVNRNKILFVTFVTNTKKIIPTFFPLREKMFHVTSDSWIMTIPVNLWELWTVCKFRCNIVLWWICYIMRMESFLELSLRIYPVENTNLYCISFYWHYLFWDTFQEATRNCLHQVLCYVALQLRRRCKGI